MALDIRVAENTIEDLLRDAILYGLGRRTGPAPDSVAALRAVTTRGQSDSQFGDTRLIQVVNMYDDVERAYRWRQSSTAADNGTTVIKPNDVTGPGRWEEWPTWASDIYFSRDVGSDSAPLAQIQDGFLRSVIVLDKSMTKEEYEALLFGDTPSVVIEATGDDPEDMTLDVGHSWITQFRFMIGVVEQNLRDYRRAARGSELASDAADPGANTIDGWIQALLAGNRLTQAEDSILAVRVGPGRNLESEGGQRRIVRVRQYVVWAHVERTNAPNEIVDAQEIDRQAQFSQPAAGAAEFDPKDVLRDGVFVRPDVGLTKNVTAGSALIAGLDVTYAGESHTFGASQLTYLDLDPSGTLTFVATGLLEPEPPVTSGAMRVAVVESDGSGVVDYRFKSALSEDYENPWVSLLS